MSRALAAQYREKGHTLWAKAKKLQTRVESNQRRLAKFSLSARIFKYHRFNKLRANIRDGRNSVFLLVNFALGALRRATLIERQLKHDLKQDLNNR